MEWIKIDFDNLPDGEVLAGNFNEGTYGYREKLVGFLWKDDVIVYCEDDSQQLGNCTHYIDIHKHDPK